MSECLYSSFYDLRSYVFVCLIMAVLTEEVWSVHLTEGTHGNCIVFTLHVK